MRLVFWQSWALPDSLPLLAWRVYNVGVTATPSTKPVAEDKHRHRHAQYAAEASGLLVIALLLLILELVRYWENISWSAR